MKTSALLALMAAGLMTSTVCAQGTYTTPSPSPPSASASKPAILRIEPKMAAAGAEVTIIGSNFKDVKQVMFSGSEAQFTVVSETEIRATVPEGSSSGPVQIVTAAGMSRSTDPFQVGTSQH